MQLAVDFELEVVLCEIGYRMAVFVLRGYVHAHQLCCGAEDVIVLRKRETRDQEYD